MIKENNDSINQKDLETLNINLLSNQINENDVIYMIHLSKHKPNYLNSAFRFFKKRLFHSISEMIINYSFMYKTISEICMKNLKRFYSLLLAI